MIRPCRNAAPAWRAAFGVRRKLARLDRARDDAFDVRQAIAALAVAARCDRASSPVSSHLWKTTSNTACVRGSVASRVSASIASVRKAASGSSRTIVPARVSACSSGRVRARTWRRTDRPCRGNASRPRPASRLRPPPLLPATCVSRPAREIRAPPRRAAARG